MKKKKASVAGKKPASSLTANKVLAHEFTCQTFDQGWGD